MTLANERDIIWANTGTEGNPRFPVVRMNLYINLARRFVQQKLNGLGYKKWEKSAALSLASGTIGSVSTQKSAIPTDMLESPMSIIMLDVTDGTNTGTSKKEIRAVDFEEVCKNSFSAPVIQEAGYTRIAGYIHIFPSTVTSGTVYYYSVIADLSADSDAETMPNEFVQFVIDEASVYVKDALGMIQDKNAAEAEVANAITDAYNKFMGTVQTREAVPSKRAEEVLQ